jgi:hypothetical protein
VTLTGWAMLAVFIAGLYLGRKTVRRKGKRKGKDECKDEKD